MGSRINREDIIFTKIMLDEAKYRYVKFLS